MSKSEKMKIAKAFSLFILLASLFAVQSVGQETNGKIFHEVEQMPVYPGGENALVMFVAESITYPEEAKKNGISGKVFVSFIVSKTGEVQDAKVVKGVHPDLDKESLRVINKLKNFEPGRHKGEPVNVAFTLPIKFALDGDGDKK